MFKTVDGLFIGRRTTHAHDAPKPFADAAPGTVHRGFHGEEHVHYAISGERLAAVGIEGEQVQVLDAHDVLRRLEAAARAPASPQAPPVELHLQGDFY